MNKFRVPVMMFLLLLIAPVALAQGEVPTDAILLPMWALILLGIVVGGVLLAFLYLLIRVIDALKTSYPPGTVDTVTAALGDGLQQIIDQLKANAPNTPTNVDDFLLEFLEPLTEEIVKRLRNEGVTSAPQTAQGVLHPPAESG